MADRFDVIEELSHNLPYSVNNLPLSLCKRLDYKPLRPSHKRARTQIAADRLAIADALLPRLPFRLLVSDDIKSTRASSWREQIFYAVTRKYIGLDSADFINAVVIDCDHDDAERWQSCGLPPPAWISATPATGRHHIVWLLAKPIRSGRGEGAVMRFLSRVRDALNHELDGDLGYTGTLTKSPFHKEWNVDFIGGEPVTLTALYAPVALAPTRASRRIESVSDDGAGRNCSLFHRLRYWAYSSFTRAGGPLLWAGAVQDQAHRLNVGACPLDAKEVAGIARSVSSWTWKRYRPSCERGVMRLAAIDIPLCQKQRMSASRTATIKRSKSRTAYDDAVAALRDAGRLASVAAIASASKLSKSTVARLRRADLAREARGPIGRPVVPPVLKIAPKGVCHSVPSGIVAFAEVVRGAGDQEQKRVESKKERGSVNKKCEISAEEIELERSWISRMTAPANDLKPLQEKRVFLRKADAFK